MILAFGSCSQVLAGGERWFLVHTQPKSEKKAEWHLHAQGFKTYVPRIIKTVRHARQLRTVKAPLFPRYLFIILDLERDRWLSVRSTIGVSRVFGHQDGRPVPVPTGIVEALIEHSDGDVTRLDDGLRTGGNRPNFSGTLPRFIRTLR